MTRHSERHLEYYQGFRRSLSRPPILFLFMEPLLGQRGGRKNVTTTSGNHQKMYASCSFPTVSSSVRDRPAQGTQRCRPTMSEPSVTTQNRVNPCTHIGYTTLDPIPETTPNICCIPSRSLVSTILPIAGLIVHSKAGPASRKKQQDHQCSSRQRPLRASGVHELQ